MTSSAENVDSCRASGGTVTGTECVFNTPAQTTPTPVQTGNNGGNAGNASATTSTTGTTPAPGEVCSGVYDPNTSKCYKDSNTAPPCPGKGGQSQGGRDAMGFCPDPVTGHPAPIVAIDSQYCGVHINHAHGCAMNNVNPHPDGSCPTGYATGGKRQDTGGPGGCRLRILDPHPDGSCPADYTQISGSKLCKVNSDTSSGVLTDELPGGYCPTGYIHTSVMSCSLEPPTKTGNTGGTSGTATNTGNTTGSYKPGGTVEVPPLKSGSCPYGSYSVGSSGNAGQPGTGSIICISTPGATTTTQTGFHIDAYGGLSKDQNPDRTCGQGTEHRPGTDPKQCMVLVVLQNKDGTCINGWTHFPGADPESCYMSSAVSTPTSGGSGTTTTTNTGTGGGTTPMTTPMKTGGATTTTGTGTTSTTNPTTTTSKTSPTSPQSSTTVTNVINKNNNVIGGSSSVVTTPPQTTNNNNFLTYLNTPDKITIRYPSTWTKTEFADNPSIPVIFNAPVNGSTATPARTTLMININNQLTPASATPDAYTQQQINALTNSSVIKYIITDTNSKVLTPPAGITAYREISYNGIKNSTVSNNNISTQIPLKGTAIFFVNGNTGYSLLYLAKQSEYNQNLPIVQQMINTFQMNATSGGPTGGGNIKS